MTGLKTASLVVLLAGAAGLGAATEPAARGHDGSHEWMQEPRVVEIFAGRGSQIGVGVRDVEESDVKAAKLSGVRGVLVDDVREDGPAAKAGMKDGDVIVEFDGERVRSVRQFTRLVQETPAGRKVQASVVRDGQRMTVSVEPSGGESNRFRWDFPSMVRIEPPALPMPPTPPMIAEFDGLFGRGGNRLGITVEEVSPQLGEYFGTKDGVLVTSVSGDSPAAKAGLKAGDVITSFGGSSVESASELRRRIQRLDNGDEFTVGIMRDKKAQTLKGRMEERRDRRSVTRT